MDGELLLTEMLPAGLLSTELLSTELLFTEVLFIELLFLVDVGFCSGSPSKHRSANQRKLVRGENLRPTLITTVAFHNSSGNDYAFDLSTRTASHSK